MGMLEMMNTLMLTLFITWEAFSVGNAQTALMINAVVGQDVTIPCGVLVNGQWGRLVWKLIGVNNSEELAVSFAGYVDCDTSKKKDCLLTQDGSLVLRNVTERDSEDYFCVLETEQKYYSHHRLIIGPEVLPPAIRECPDPEDVFVYQTGPQEMVLAYPSPVCSNSDEIGNITCSPPSGAKIEISVTEIACQCTHSGILVDTCEIPIPAAVGCSQVTGLWIFIGILIGVSISTWAFIALAVWYFRCRSMKSSKKLSAVTANVTYMDEHGINNAEGYKEVNQSDQDEELVSQDPTLVLGKTQSGKLLASVTESDNDAGDCPDNDAVDCLDGDMQTENDSQQSFNEMKQICVNGEMPKFRILPCRQKPSNGIEIKCQFCGNLHVNMCHRDGDVSPDIQFDFKTCGLSVNVTKLVTFPVNITCGKCGESCCLLEAYGDKWIE